MQQSRKRGSLRQGCFRKNSVLHICCYLVMLEEGIFSPLPSSRTTTTSWYQVSRSQDYWPVPLSQILRPGVSWGLLSLFHMFEEFSFQGNNVVIIMSYIPPFLPFSSSVWRILPSWDFKHKILRCLSADTAALVAKNFFPALKKSLLGSFSSGHKCRNHVLTCNLSHILGL